MSIEAIRIAPTSDAPATPKRTRKPRAPKTAPPVTETPPPCHAAPAIDPKPIDRSLTHYATAGVVTMSLMSAVLNGYAHAQHASVVWAGWWMGIMVPVVILLLGKVAGLLQKRGYLQAAKVTAGSGLGLLFLSVWHCSEAISLLTGSPLVLALPMAVAIDVGFTCCEYALLCDEQPAE